MRRIGILGGMGPQATLLLMQKLIDALEDLDDVQQVYTSADFDDEE